VTKNTTQGPPQIIFGGHLMVLQVGFFINKYIYILNSDRVGGAGGLVVILQVVLWRVGAGVL